MSSSLLARLDDSAVNNIKWEVMITSKDVEGNEYAVTAGELAWRPSAYGIVIRGSMILLVKENDRYHLPGGGIDLGEDPERAVIRELKEETGVTASDATLLNVASSFFSFGAFDEPSNLTHVHALLFYYVCGYVSTDARDIHLDKYEKLAGLSAEWIETDRLATIVVGTTVDWRPVVGQLLS
jgi:8-oxo-dGTP diphosphatase